MSDTTEATSTETDETAEGTEATTAEAGTSAEGTTDEGGSKDSGKGSKDAVLADLAKERKARQALEAQLAKFERERMSEAEKAVADAKDSTRAEVTATFGQKLAAAEIKAALTGVVPDPATVVGDLNLAKYVTETGDVDSEAVAALRERWVAIVGPERRFQGGGDGGARQEGSAPTLAEQIAEAEKAGDINTSMRLKAQQLLQTK